MCGRVWRGGSHLRTHAFPAGKDHSPGLDTVLSHAIAALLSEAPAGEAGVVIVFDTHKGHTATINAELLVEHATCPS